MKILYVDDDLEDQEFFHDAVKAVDPSIAFFSARNGNELFELLGKGTLPDHIVLDINMPGMDGQVCLQELRKDPRLDSVKIIVYSTNSFPRDLQHIEALGARFIQKANSFSDLCRMIQQLKNQGGQYRPVLPGTAPNRP